MQEPSALYVVKNTYLCNANAKVSYFCNIAKLLFQKFQKMKIPNNISCLIFDLGGVIVNLDWDRCVENFRKIGAHEMENLLSTTLQKGFILDYERGMISTDEFRASIRQMSKQHISNEAIDNAWTSLLVDVPEEKLQLLLDLKKKYKIFMLSNTNEMSFNYCVENYFSQNGTQLNDYFDKCYLSYEMKLNKPEVAIYQAILDDNDVKPEECLFFDDSRHNLDVAKCMGIHTMYVKPYSEIQLEI